MEKQKNDFFQKILNQFSNQELKLESIFSNKLYNFVGVVINQKLAGRKEDVKFIESVEPNTREVFLRGGEVLSCINHKNIPKIYDILTRDNIILFRSEHIEGYSLQEIINELHKQKKKFPKSVANKIIFKLLKSLYYIHNHVNYKEKKVKVYHCDIKPSNIILSVKGIKRTKKFSTRFLDKIIEGKFEPYLIDFGIAKFETTKQSNQGTLNYLSFETLLNKKETWRTDTYQLFLVYYEILTGKKPFLNLTRKQIIEQKINDKFEIAEVSKNIKKIIEKATSQKNHFKTEEEMLKKCSRFFLLEKKKEYLNIFK